MESWDVRPGAGVSACYIITCGKPSRPGFFRNFKKACPAGLSDAFRLTLAPWNPSGAGRRRGLAPPCCSAVPVPAVGWGNSRWCGVTNIVLPVGRGTFEQRGQAPARREACRSGASPLSLLPGSYYLLFGPRCPGFRPGVGVLMVPRCFFGRQTRANEVFRAPNACKRGFSSAKRAPNGREWGVFVVQTSANEGGSIAPTIVLVCIYKCQPRAQEGDSIAQRGENGVWACRQEAIWRVFVGSRRGLEGVFDGAARGLRGGLEMLRGFNEFFPRLSLAAGAADAV
jgi:hypothetical protein